MSSIGKVPRKRSHKEAVSSDIDIYDSGAATESNSDYEDTSSGSGTDNEHVPGQTHHHSDIEMEYQQLEPNIKKIEKLLSKDERKQNNEELEKQLIERAQQQKYMSSQSSPWGVTPPQPVTQSIQPLPPPPMSLSQQQHYQVPTKSKSKKKLAPGERVRTVGNYQVYYNQNTDASLFTDDETVARELESIANPRHIMGLLDQNDQRGAHLQQIDAQIAALQKQREEMEMTNEHVRQTVTLTRSRTENIEDDFYTSWLQQVKDIRIQIIRLNNEHHNRAANPHGIHYPDDAVTVVEALVLKLDRAWNLSEAVIAQANQNNKLLTLIDETANAFNASDDVEAKQRFQRILEARGVNMEHPYMTLMQRHFGIGLGDTRLISPQELYEKYNEICAHLSILEVYIGSDLMRCIQFINDRQKLALLRAMVVRCLGLTQWAYRCVMGYYGFFLFRTTRADEQTIIGSDITIVRELPRQVGLTREDRMDRLVEYTLNEAHILGFRICLMDEKQPILYKPIQSKFTHEYTQTFRPFTTLQEFIHSIFAKHVCNPDRYLDFTRSGSKAYESIFHAIKGKIDTRLPKLVKIRYCFSFEDGIFSAYSQQFKPYKTREGTGIPAEKACANYFPIYFENHPDIQEKLKPYFTADPSQMSRKQYAERFMLIPTPVVDQILDNQEFSYEVKLWFWVMLGRLLFDTGSRDRWGIVPWFKGPAGTGKSTILERLIGGMYQSEDWYSLSTKTEANFGLSSYYQKFLVVAPEVKENFQLDSSDFQLMTMGEPIELRAKFLTAKKVLWTVSMAFGGNVVPRWDDQAGSIGRRILAFQFANTPDKEDGNLSFDAERGLIIRKAAHAYNHMLAHIEHVKGSVWNFVPEYFLERRREFQSSTNSLVNFLQSGKLRYGPPRQVYMSSKKFMEMYVLHCRQNNLVQQKWNEDNYYKPLLDAKCAFVITNKTNAHKIGKLHFPGWMPLPYPRPMHISGDLSPSPNWNGAVISDSIIYGCDEYNSPIPECQKTIAPPPIIMNSDDDGLLSDLVDNTDGSDVVGACADTTTKKLMVAPFPPVTSVDHTRHYVQTLDEDQDMTKIITPTHREIENIQYTRKRRDARRRKRAILNIEKNRSIASLPNPEASVVLTPSRRGKPPVEMSDSEVSDYFSDVPQLAKMSSPSSRFIRQETFIE